MSYEEGSSWPPQDFVLSNLAMLAIVRLYKLYLAIAEVTPFPELQMYDSYILEVWWVRSLVLKTMRCVRGVASLYQWRVLNVENTLNTAFWRSVVNMNSNSLWTEWHNNPSWDMSSQLLADAFFSECNCSWQYCCYRMSWNLAWWWTPLEMSSGLLWSQLSIIWKCKLIGYDIL